MIQNPFSAGSGSNPCVRMALVILLPGLLVCSTNLHSQSPADFAQGNPPKFEPESVKVELSGLFVDDPKKTSSRPTRKMEDVSMALQAHGLPSHLVLKVDRVDASLKTQAGEALPIQSRSNPIPLSSPAVTALQAALGDVRLYAADDLTFDIVPMFSLQRSLVQQYWTDRLQFAATLDLQVAEYRVKDRRPLKTTAFEGGENDAVVLKMDSTGKPQAGSAEAAGEEIQILQNPIRKEALLGRPRFTFNPSTSTLSLNGWMFLNEDSPSGTILTPEWLAQAEVVTLQLHKVASFQRTFLRDPLQLSFDLPGQRGKTSDYDAKALEDLTLPRGATRQQMRDYVDAILAISKKQKHLGYEDPQVAMLMKVGPHNLDILIDAAPVPRTWKDLHIWKAMREMVKEQNNTMLRDLILSRLANHPELAELLSHSEWREAARPILLQGLDDGRNDLTAEWIDIILSFRDPKTYPALTEYYLRNPTEPGLYERIRAIPGIELGPKMADVWQKAKEGTIRQQSFAIHAACEWGVMDALATAADWLRPSATDYQHRVGRAVFKKFTPVEGTDEEMLAWFDTHKTTLRFDTDRKIFLPGSSPSGGAR